MTGLTPLPPGIRRAEPDGIRIEAPGSNQVLGQAEFLRLMVAQLKNQDPTKPVDNTEYVAQMAQFSTVAGIAETNSLLARIEARLSALEA
jgi:flagellar basal-body rod modification protein FlgD